MGEYVQKKRKVQRQRSPGIKRADAADAEAEPQSPLILQLQREIGNEAVQRLVQADPEGLGMEAGSSAVARLAQDRTLMPAQGGTAARVQRRPAAGTPEDAQEQQAESVAGQMMSMQAPAVQRQASPEPVVDAGVVFVADPRRSRDKKFALRIGQEDAARIRRRGRLTVEHRKELNAKLRFFEGDAKDVYAQQIKTAIETAGQPVVDVGVVFVADPERRSDKKFALREGQADAAEIHRNGKVSADYRQVLNAKLRFFEGDAKDVYAQEIKAAMEQIIPTLETLRDFCRGAINDVWQAQNQGLADFENEVSGGVDWGAFMMNVAGNLLWALASFATGEVAFVISVEGVGLASLGTATASVQDVKGFHAEARKKIDALKAYLDGRIDEMTRKSREQGLEYGWDDNRTREELLKWLLKPEYVQVVAGGVPVIDLPALAGSVEKELLFRAATTPWKSAGGWEHGVAWLEFNYTIDNVNEDLFKATPPSQWSEPKTHWIYIFPLGESMLADMNKRLNTLHDEVLHQPKDTQLWPIRKSVVVLLRRVGEVGISLRPDNSIESWGTKADDRYIRQYLKFAGIEGDPKTAFPEFLLKHLWPQSNGKPPVIEKLFMGG